MLESLLTRIEWLVLVGGLVRMGATLVLALVANLVLIRLLRRLEKHLMDKQVPDGDVPTESSKRINTLMRLIRQGAVILLWAIVLLIIFDHIGVKIGPILAGAGILGLAVGFGAQNLVRDVISGFFLILENQIRVGDVAIVNGTGGVVERINFRTTILRDLSGVVHIFPNGTITTLSNMTNEWSAYVFEISVAYKEDVNQVIELIHSVGAEIRNDPEYGPLILEDVEVFGLDKLADSGVVVKGRIKTKPIMQWKVGREFLRRVKMLFDEKGIEIPFPHTTVYFGEASKPFELSVLDKKISAGAFDEGTGE
ncbi:MAG: mechanosensitive ion channel family protein [Desulfonatronovibrionaceae bacterium]